MPRPSDIEKHCRALGKADKQCTFRRRTELKGCKSVVCTIQRHSYEEANAAPVYAHFSSTFYRIHRDVFSARPGRTKNASATDSFRDSPFYASLSAADATTQLNSAKRTPSGHSCTESAGSRHFHGSRLVYPVMVNAQRQRKPGQSAFGAA